MTRVGRRIYQDQLVARVDPRGIPYYWLGGPPPSGIRVPGTDFNAVVNRRVSVTPIHLDLTGRRLLRQLQTWDWAMPDDAAERRAAGRRGPAPGRRGRRGRGAADRGGVAARAPRERRASTDVHARRLDPRRVPAARACGDPPAMDVLRRLRAALPTPDRAPSARVAGRPGYDASRQRTLDRVRPMLAAEPVVWLSTVRPDGLPHLVPTWFWWDGEALLVFSKPDAVKVRNLRANPRLMLALGNPERGLLGRPDRGRRRRSSPVAPRSPTRSSPSTRTSSRTAASIATTFRRPTPRRSGSSRRGSSPGADAAPGTTAWPGHSRSEAAVGRPGVRVARHPAPRLGLIRAAGPRRRLRAWHV